MSTDGLLCAPARLDWSQATGPRADDYGDVYYSAEDGLEETRAVFLKGCDLPDAWTGKSGYVVGELGFGTGLNALALWDLWTSNGPKTGWLHFLSVEKHPLSREEASRAFKAWPSLKPLSDQLLAQWPSAFKGPHRMIFPADRFSITVFQDECDAALAQMDARVNAWFLDGFSPAKNESMWSQGVFEQMARLSAPGARIGTFTVAGAVRRGLQSAGFEVEKCPGFGRKRERLEAVYAGENAPLKASPYAPSLPVNGRIAVIGAGIAGASLARAFAMRGRDVVLVDALGVAQGASGGPAGLLTPRLERMDRPHVRATLAAFEFARNLYGDLDGFFAEGGLRLPRDDDDIGRIQDLCALMGEGYHWDGQGMWMARAGRFLPARLVASLIGNVDVLRRDVGKIEEASHGVSLVSRSGSMIMEADAVIYANGADAAQICGAITSSAGQLAVVGGEPPKNPIIWGGYVCASDEGDVVMGATHEKGAEIGPVDHAVTEFRAGVAHYVPQLSSTLGPSVKMAWSGIRASTPDFLPVCGAVPASDFATRWGDHARGVQAPVKPRQDQARTYVLSGLGSRGFAHAPLLAEALASEICGEPSPLERAGREVFHPARFAYRNIKRG